jgi:DNA polymerase
MAKRRLHLDLETRSQLDLRRVGVHKYAKHHTTDVILARWRIDQGQVHTWRKGEPLPDELREALADPEVIVVAHNAAFERIMLRDLLGPRYGWPVVPLERWDCTMARARACSLPGALDKATAALGLSTRKDMAGHRLMLQMCKPRRNVTVDDNVAASAILNPLQFTPLDDGRWIEWWADEARIQRLADYCGGDVEAECALDRILPPLQELEREVWICTERMNDRGVRFDLAFIALARQAAEDTRAALDYELRELTGRVVPKASNVPALKRWLQAQGVDLRRPPAEGEEIEEEEDEDEEDRDPELRRNDILRLLNEDHPDDVLRALRIRLEAGKASTKKLDAITARVDDDGRVRGLLTYHGANTGRYAATGGVQIQNFPRDVVKDWEEMLALLQQGCAFVDALAGPVLDILSRMLRGSIIPAKRREIANADYAQVEARGVAWLAGQQDLVDAFHSGAKIYERMAARIFGIPERLIDKDGLERFIGKQTVLGCGYQVGALKFVATCANFGKTVSLELAQRAVALYRESYPCIPALWRDMERAAIEAVQNPGVSVAAAGGKIVFRRDGNWLRMKLPSGRYLRYYKPRIGIDEKFGTSKLFYWGVNSRTKKWMEQSTYGGRLTENAVQAICRDLMVLGLLRLERAGYEPITTVHDEIICEPEIGHGSPDEMCALMCELPAWAADFPLAAEGKRARRYSK